MLERGDVKNGFASYALIAERSMRHGLIKQMREFTITGIVRTHAATLTERLVLAHAQQRRNVHANGADQTSFAIERTDQSVIIVAPNVVASGKVKR